MSKSNDTYEKAMHEMMTYAVGGLFLFPIICGFISHSWLTKITEQYEIPTRDLWKATLVRWEFGIGIVRLLLIVGFVSAQVLSATNGA